VDLALLVVDAAHGDGRGDGEAAARVRESGVTRLAVLNKIDRVTPKSRPPPAHDDRGGAVGAPGGHSGVRRRPARGATSSSTASSPYLPESEPLFPEDFLTDQPERVLAAEWVREKILHHTREEIPTRPPSA
jgi:GTP-binding protein Era